MSSSFPNRRWTRTHTHTRTNSTPHHSHTYIIWQRATYYRDRSTYPNRILVRIYFLNAAATDVRFLLSYISWKRWGAFFSLSLEFAVSFCSELTELFFTSQIIQRFQHEQNHWEKSNETIVQYWIHVRIVVEWRPIHGLKFIYNLHSSAHNLMSTVVNIEIVNCIVAARHPFDYYLLNAHRMCTYNMSSDIWQVSCIRHCLWWMVRFRRRRIFVCR